MLPGNQEMIAGSSEIPFGDWKIMSEQDAMSDVNKEMMSEHEAMTVVN